MTSFFESLLMNNETVFVVVVKNMFKFPRGLKGGGGGSISILCTFIKLFLVQLLKMEKNSEFGSFLVFVFTKIR